MPRGCAEINVARQLADDQQIETGDDFRLQRGCACQFRIQNGGTEVGKQFQILAQSQNRLFRTQGTFQRIVFEIADRAEQNRIGLFRQFERTFRQRMTVRRIACAADIGPFHFEIFTQRIQNPNGFIHDFRADTVARQNCNLHV